MPIELGATRYGKSSVRVFKVHEDGDVSDLTVQVLCEGDFDLVHIAGDNSPVVPTDTIRNTVYCFAQDRLGKEIERFARILCAHFLEFPQITGVWVEIEERPWHRIGAHQHAHTPAAERRVVSLSGGSCGDRVGGGIRDLVLLKTAGSAFTGFTRDRYTTLPEETDRLLATEVNADWRYHGHPADYTELWWDVRRILMEAFAGPASNSVQEQGWLMGRAVLEARPEIDEISLRLPNRHHLRVDLSRFEMEDRGVVFHPVSEPYGDISLVVRRT